MIRSNTVPQNTMKFTPSHVQTVLLTAAVFAVGDSDGKDGRLTAVIDVPIWRELLSCMGTAAGEVPSVTVTVYSPAGDTSPGCGALIRFH